MKYIKHYDNFKPIKINNAKPFKVKKNISKSIQFLQKRINSLRRRMQEQESLKKRSEMNREISSKIQKLSDLTRYQLKQAEYLKNNPVTENVQIENAQPETTKPKYNTLLELLESETFEPADILNYIGIDENEYEIPTEYKYGEGYVDKISYNGFVMVTKFKTVEYIMGVESNIFRYIESWTTSYNQNEYYVDNDEMNYLHNYITDEISEKIKKLADLFDYEINIEGEGEIVKLFEYLGLNSSLEDFKTEIAYENERAIEKAAKELISSLPFQIESFYDHNNRDFDCELYFDFDEMFKFIKEHNKGVSTIENFLESVSNAIDIGYEFEYDMKYGYIGDFEDLKKNMNNELDKYVDNPDDVFPKLIEQDRLELFKDKVEELALFDTYYDFWFKYDRKHMNLVEMAILYDNSITKWMCTKEFRTILKEKVSNELYNDLTEKLLNYETEGDMKKYNL